jgi:hypothetical protein
MSAPEGFIPLNGSAGNSAPVGGRKHRSRKLKLVTRKQARTMLKKLGRKMRGGAPGDVVGATTPPVATGGALGPDGKEMVMAPAEEGGRRRHRRGTKKTHRKSRGRKFLGVPY